MSAAKQSFLQRSFLARTAMFYRYLADRPAQAIDCAVIIGGTLLPQCGAWGCPLDSCDPRY